MSARQGAVPLFALYQGPQHRPDAAKGEARSACRQPGANDRMGCIVGDASSLNAANPTTRNQWQAEASLGLPLHCLVACFCHGSASGTPPLPPWNAPTGPPPPPFAGPTFARNVVGRAAFAAARESQRSSAVIERLVAALDAPRPVDRLGDYWDRHNTDLTDLDAEGSELFEDISHIVVLDERE